MHRAFKLFGIVYYTIILSVQLSGISVFARQDKLAERWEGRLQSPQIGCGTKLIVKKESDVYTGCFPQWGDGLDVNLEDFKVDGDKVKANA